MRRGFTLVELILVIAVIALLAGLGIAVAGKVRRDALCSASRTTVEAIATDLATRPAHRSWTTPSGPRVARAWDLNASAPGAEDAVGDALIDGRVAGASTDGPFAPSLVADGYRGFAAETLYAGKLSPREGRPIDAWGHPIAIAWDPATGHAVVSSGGPDGVLGDADDIIAR